MQVKVIVDRKHASVDKPYSYNVPTPFQEVIECGMRVEVNFGYRTLMGIVVKVENINQNDKLKDIVSVLDTIPCIKEELISLSHDIKKQTNSTYQSIFKAMIPSALKVKYVRKIKIIDEAGVNLTIRSKFKNETEIFDDRFSDDLKDIKKLIKQNIIKEEIFIEDKVKYKFSTYIKLISDFNEENYKNKKAQLKVLEYLDIRKEVKRSDLLKDTRVSSSVIKTLEKNKVIEIIKTEVYRDIETIEYKDKRVSLTDKQKSISESIFSNKEYNTNLIHGITGSGKTEVYLDLIEKNLNENKTSIMLVPEISLTPQMVKRFKARFGEEIAIMHSNLSLGERFDEFRRVQRKEAKIVVGVRSAIFAPLENIGIIIIDEEHDSSYKQDIDPKYNTVDIAKLRAKYNNCNLVLGSATPSVKTYYKAVNKEYNLYEINKRPGTFKLPRIEIVNPKYESNDTYKLISDKLKKKIIEKKELNEQSILILNRKGYASFVLCRDCNETIECPNCDISLTYYESRKTLKCHYCSYEIKKIDFCPKCTSENIMEFGIGIEKLEEELNELIPNIRVIRMDSDTTSKKGSHRKILEKFENKEFDVLIGTQMIAKGLDFENVTLVGIISADMQLSLPDFKAAEKTYQLISQSAGRAGRGEKNGEVIIQTFNEQHYAIVAAKENSYKDFYKNEIEYRKLAKYEPFTNMSQIILSGNDRDKLINESENLTNKMKNDLKEVLVLGPIIPRTFRLKNKYRVQIILKYKKEYELYSVFNKLIKRYAGKDIYISIDNNPSFI